MKHNTVWMHFADSVYADSLLKNYSGGSIIDYFNLTEGSGLIFQYVFVFTCLKVDSNSENVVTTLKLC